MVVKSSLFANLKCIPYFTDDLFIFCPSAWVHWSVRSKSNMWRQSSILCVQTCCLIMSSCVIFQVLVSLYELLGPEMLLKLTCIHAYCVTKITKHDYNHNKVVINHWQIMKCISLENFGC